MVDDEELSIAVEQFGVLYDKSHPDFHRKDIKNNAWKAVEINAPLRFLSWFVGLIQNLLPLSFAFCRRRRRLLKIMIATASMWCLFSAAIFENDFKKNSLAAYCLRMNEWNFRTCDRRISQPALRSFYVSLLRSFQRKRNVNVT